MTTTTSSAAAVATPASRGHVMVVDDDALFLESVSTNLTNAGYLANAFQGGEEAVGYLSRNGDADLLLLDWKMPGISGIEVMQRLRADNIDIPIIFLTMLSDQIYEEAGLLGGAVDFIEKSRSFAILLRRIELILSGEKIRAAAEARHGTDSVTSGALTLRYDSRRALWKQANVELTLTEFNIVAFLVENSARDVSYREIYDIVHGEGFMAGDGEVGFRTNVRAFIKRIRQKFRDADPNFASINNYPGFGYRWLDGNGQ
ncbi:MAG TPA: response regulator transcription factor [Bryobacteraceae bacterium]|nr:response regulator transcription factor [Bryobacteraceae bacterium]